MSSESAVRFVALLLLFSCLLATAENIPDTASPVTAPVAAKVAENSVIKKKAKRNPAETTPSTISPSGVNSLAESLHYEFEMDTFMGASRFNGPGVGFTVGGRFGYSPFFGVPFYVGPEVDFFLFSPGSMVTALAAGWYEYRIVSGAPYLLEFGAEGGGVFPQGVPSIPSINYAAFANLTLYRELNDLGCIGLTIRPGIVANGLAIMANFTIQFRFL